LNQGHSAIRSGVTAMMRPPHTPKNKAKAAKKYAEVDPNLAGGKRASWDVKGMMADEKRKTILLKAKLQEKHEHLEETHRNLRETSESGGPDRLAATERLVYRV
jgi:hypothetical protein